MPQSLDSLVDRDRGTPGGLEQIARVEDLNVVYEARGRQLHAVRGVQLAIHRGEILALVGESGSGKSSVAMALLGLLQEGSSQARASGAASVLGVDLLSAPRELRRSLRRERLGAVFQDPMSSLNPTMTIGRQLLETASDPERAESLLESVGVPEAKLRLRSYPHELSGGQRQRVMIAMAIARNPALVVADEPTTALDVTIQAQILALIRRLCDELGCAFLLVTHDLGVAAQVADRIAVCYAGRVVETGPAAELLRRPSHPYTAGLMRSRITLSSDRTHLLPTLPGEPPDLRKPPPGCPFAPRCRFRQDACEARLPELAPLEGRLPELAPIEGRLQGLAPIENSPAPKPAEGPPELALAETPAQLSACIRVAEIGAQLTQQTQDLAAAPRHPGGAGQAPALRITGVHKAFRLRVGGWRRSELQALRGVDLEVGASECVALVGESGSGKSTLLRVAADLIRADRGSVELQAGKRPQMIFQDAGASLTSWLTVGEQLAEGMRSAGVPRALAAERASESLERVGLSAAIAKRKPGQLSGGQRQRVAIARAIVSPPAILLCDEPTSSLDVSLAATVLNLIGRLRQELGIAVLFVTHDLAAARYVADRIAVMYLGQVVEVGPAEAIAAAPSHPYTRTLLSAVPGIERERTAIHATERSS